YRGVGSRADRREDWGDPAYLAGVAEIPGHLRAQGVKISKLVLIGVSYAGFGNAELVATHPELRPAALILVDSYLDLPARYAALPTSATSRTCGTRTRSGIEARACWPWPLSVRPTARSARGLLRSPPEPPCLWAATAAREALDTEVLRNGDAVACRVGRANLD